MKYGKSLKTADRCKRRFMANLNRTAVFEAVITRTLQHAGRTVSEKQTSVNCTVSEKQALYDDRCVADCAVSEKDTLVNNHMSDHRPVAACTLSEKETLVNCTESERQSLVNDPVSDSCVADSTVNEKQTLVNCTGSEKDAVTNRESCDSCVAVILNCSRPVHTDNNLSDMTATHLRQLLVSQHIQALLTAARSVIFLFFSLSKLPNTFC